MEVGMAILRRLDEKFYEIPDEVLSSYQIPEEKVKERLESHGGDSDQLDDEALKAVTGGSASAPASEWHNVWHNGASPA
jgi:hypothetical protein